MNQEREGDRGTAPVFRDVSARRQDHRSLVETEFRHVLINAACHDVPQHGVWATKKQWEWA